METENDMRTMHLFAGIGGGLLADLILGHKPVVAVEWDRYACQVLRERSADGWFPDLQVWEGDVRLFNPSEYAGKVDCIHAGFPCQDISVAGKQAGVSEGTRSGLYREVLRIADTVRPRYLFLENVAAILSNGLGTVLGDLAAMGYDARWCCLRASNVGAPHHRDRWWCLCTNSDSNKRGASSLEQDPRADRRNDVSGMGEILADAQKLGFERCGTSWDRRNGLENCGENVADANIPQCQGNKRTIRIREEYPDIGGVSWWKTEPCVGRVANGVPNRIHRLKGLGNAQVPLQAAVAWKLLGGQ